MKLEHRSAGRTIFILLFPGPSTNRDDVIQILHHVLLDIMSNDAVVSVISQFHSPESKLQEDLGDARVLSLRSIFVYPLFSAAGSLGSILPAFDTFLC